MLARTHQTTALAAGFLVADYLQINPTIAPIALVALGSLLPDIDSKSSKIGRYVPFIANRLKHRGFTHSIHAILLFVGITYLTQSLNSAALTFGITMHIVCDAFSSQGLNWTMSTKKPIQLPLHYVTGGKLESLLFTITLFYSIYRIVTIV